VCRTTTI
ncbi:hypothetical protein CP061683_0039B, partial [Chlamydia psittaci 06-1683]